MRYPGLIAWDVFLLILMLVSGTIGATTGQVYRIDTQNSQEIRKASHLVNHPVLREIVLEWVKSIPRGQIEISYVQGKEGKMLAMGLRSGLIALGIPSKFISLHGSKIDMRYMELRVISAEKP
jgi:hypothetical protein